MATFDICTADPKELTVTTLCLDELSKDVEGELLPLSVKERTCPTWDCRTLVTHHRLFLKDWSHACDSKLGSLLDGEIEVKDLVTVWADGDAGRRGIHRGLVSWRSSVAVLQGRLSGVSNVGTHREPAFQGCQTCDERGVLEGQLCATVVQTSEPALAGAQLNAAYRLRFDPTKEGGAGGVQGTLEGVVVRTCRPNGDCVEFTTPGTGSNPRVTGPLTILVRDFAGNPTPDTSVHSFGGPPGLDIGFDTELTFAQPMSRVELTLATWATPARATAFDTSGHAVDSAAMSGSGGPPETLVLSGAGIGTVRIEAPSDETLLTRVCWTP